MLIPLFIYGSLFASFPLFPPFSCPFFSHFSFLSFSPSLLLPSPYDFDVTLCSRPRCLTRLNLGLWIHVSISITLGCCSSNWPTLKNSDSPRTKYWQENQETWLSHFRRRSASPWRRHCAGASNIGQRAPWNCGGI